MRLFVFARTLVAAFGVSIFASFVYAAEYRDPGRFVVVVEACKASDQTKCQEFRLPFGEEANEAACLMGGWVNATRYVIQWNEAPGHDKLSIQRISCAPADEKHVYPPTPDDLRYRDRSLRPWRLARQRQLFTFGVGEDAGAREEGDALGSLHGKAGAAARNHVDDELRMAPIFELVVANIKGAAADFAEQHIMRTDPEFLCGIAQGAEPSQQPPD